MSSTNDRFELHAILTERPHWNQMSAVRTGCDVTSNPRMCLHVNGDFDVALVLALQKAIGTSVRVQQETFIFDLKEATSISARGIGLPAGLYEYISGKGGDLIVAGANEMIRDMFSATHLSRFIMFCDNVAEAEKRCGTNPLS